MATTDTRATASALAATLHGDGTVTYWGLPCLAGSTCLTLAGWADGSEDFAAWDDAPAGRCEGNRRCVAAAERIGLTVGAVDLDRGIVRFAGVPPEYRCLCGRGRVSHEGGGERLCERCVDERADREIWA